MRSTVLVIFCLSLSTHRSMGQFVFKDESESKKGLQHAYMSFAAPYATGKDIGAVFTNGVGLETGITYAIVKNLHLTPRGYLHYFPNYPSDDNYNDHLWLWNFGLTTSYQIPIGESGFNISPLISIGYKGGTNLITFPFSDRGSLNLMKFNGLDIAPGLMIEKSNYFVRISYDIYLNRYKLNEAFVHNNIVRPPSKPYGPIYTSAYRTLDMSYINLTIGYHFDFFL